MLRLLKSIFMLSIIIMILPSNIRLVNTPTSNAQSSNPIEFHCALDEACPEVMIEGDPFATLNSNPAPFRGYGDPSLEYDTDTDTLWLSYSWLSVLVTSGDGAPLIDFGVETHLARSDDNGQSFQFVRKVNETYQTQNNNQPVWVTDEVSVVVKW